MAKLLEVLHELVDQGNTVVVIEHNLEVIKTADWVIDMGPEGGSGGGEIVAQGTPEDIAESKASHTGRFMKEVLARRPLKKEAAPKEAARKAPAKKDKKVTARAGGGIAASPLIEAAAGGGSR